MKIKKKYPELAKAISKHKYMLVGQEEGPKTWEEKILTYADKRVAHDKVVSLEQRKQDALARYKNHKYIKVEARDKELLELEKEIFDKIKIKPEDIK